MYSIGDKVAYPMYGAGVIEKIEKQDVLGEVRQYYVVVLPLGNMKIMVPIGGGDDVGMRYILTGEDMDAVEDILRKESTSMSSNWNRRYRDNMDKLKTGDLAEVAEVVRNLIRIEQHKKLSTGEKKLLNNAKQILISEYALVRELEYEIASEKIQNIILSIN